MILHPLELTRSIFDPIHGLIKLTDEELEVIDHPLFQRLRHTRQNSLLYYVFPSAHHTRFEHGLGTLFVADEILQALHFNSLSMGTKTHNASDTILVDWNNEQLQLRELYRVTRLAALCHDLGHGPLSHTYEAFAPDAAALDSLLTAPEIQTIRPLLPTLATCTVSGRLTHEALSGLLFAKIWYDLHGNREPEIPLAVVSAVIDAPTRATCGIERWIPLAHDIIAGTPVDADRIDYVERDGRVTSNARGLFDYPLLLESFLAYYRGSGSGAVPRLGIAASGRGAVENLVLARFRMYTDIYYHKTNRAVELMLRRVARLARSAGLTVGSTSTLADIERTLCELSDDSFVACLCGHGPFPIVHKEINELSQQVYERKLWKRVYDAQSSTSSITRDVYEQLHHEFGDEFDLDLIEPIADKDIVGGLPLLCRTVGGDVRLEEQSSWVARSPMLQGLTEDEKTRERVYYCGHSDERAFVLRQRAAEIISAFG